MAEVLHIPADGSTPEEKYRILLPQIKSLVEGEIDLIANMANVSSVLKSVFKHLWVGFYIVKNNELVLGPYQGPVACTRISYGKGVCGKAWEEQTCIIVPDVNSFPGHIACSSESKSEIVIPGFSKKKVIFVLDIDSAQMDSFNETDRIYLEKIVKLITDISDC
ncbi:MAG: GAF domain-containing protein [Cyclobacteriaceae bacterium]|jgi:GAF domain-containing protein